MKVIYAPPAEASAGGGFAKITLGADEAPDETLVLREGEDPVEVPPEFEDAVRAHEDIEVVE